LAKVKNIYKCSNCGAESPKWIGKCPSCNEWNTYHEEVVLKGNKTIDFNTDRKSGKNKPTLISHIESGQFERIPTPDDELNRVFGGGIVPGSVTLISGQPGIGKSTLMLQVALFTPGIVLYVTGEESEEQIKLRADRLGTQVSECYVLSGTEVSTILKQAEILKPDIIIIDSIQTMYLDYLESSVGTVTQIREATNALQRFAKENNTAVIIIGHITKDGDIAGPKLLEHLVDIVLYFEGDRNYIYRILRSRKNRFGSSDEIGIYEMWESGLRAVENTSEVLTNKHNEPYSGNALAIITEGTRNYLIEVQALVSRAVYGTPQRSSTGYDTRRMNMLLAVLEKKCQLPLGYNDVFLNIAGGLKVEDPSIDLALAASVISSLENKPVSATDVFIGEIGLSGEVRPAPKIAQKINEARKLGIKRVFISKYSKNVNNIEGIEVVLLTRVDQLLDIITSD
jgi:DNA repair protein RadA/Sms